MVEAYVKAVLAAKKLACKEKIELLQAKGPDDFSGLYMAFQNGHTQFIEAYVKVVMETNQLTTSQKIELFEGININGLLNPYLEKLKKLSTPKNSDLFKLPHGRSEDIPRSPVIKSSWV